MGIEGEKKEGPLNEVFIDLLMKFYEKQIVKLSELKFVHFTYLYLCSECDLFCEKFISLLVLKVFHSKSHINIKLHSMNTLCSLLAHLSTLKKAIFIKSVDFILQYFKTLFHPKQ